MHNIEKTEVLNTINRAIDVLEVSVVDLSALAFPVTVTMARRLDKQGAMKNHDFASAARLVGIACAEAFFNVATLTTPRPELVVPRLAWQVGADKIGVLLTPEIDQNSIR